MVAQEILVSTKPFLEAGGLIRKTCEPPLAGLDDVPGKLGSWDVEIGHDPSLDLHTSLLDEPAGLARRHPER